MVILQGNTITGYCVILIAIPLYSTNFEAHRQSVSKPTISNTLEQKSNKIACQVRRYTLWSADNLQCTWQILANWITTKKIGGQYVTSTWSHQKSCFHTGGSGSQAPEKAFRRYLTRSSPQCFVSCWYLNTLNVISASNLCTFWTMQNWSSYFDTSVTFCHDTSVKFGRFPTIGNSTKTLEFGCVGSFHILLL